MEAILFFCLLVVVLLVLNIIDMVAKPREEYPLAGQEDLPELPEQPPLVDSTGRPLHGPALARARAARRAAQRALENTPELAASAETSSK
jgi:hypothetical protein